MKTTMKDLEGLVERLNKVTGNNTSSWTKKDGEPMKANIGNFHLDGAYGGWALHQMMNESGGVNDVFNSGHITKKELYNQIVAYIRGIESVKVQ